MLTAFENNVIDVELEEKESATHPLLIQSLEIENNNLIIICIYRKIDQRLKRHFSPHTKSLLSWNAVELMAERFF